MSTNPGRSLVRLLDAPNLARVVQTLSPETLHRVIAHCGLEACVELVGLATAAQLTAIVDLDVWCHPDPGRDEQFDASRFGEWLEALTHSDVTLAAKTIAALDPQVIAFGLSRFVRVFDRAAVGALITLEGDYVETQAILEPSIAADIGGYQVRARQADAWDAIVALLVALDADHPAAFATIMRRCRRLSDSGFEPDVEPRALDAGQLAFDIATERATRRSGDGYVEAAEARSFLASARRHDVAASTPTARHPAVAEHVRDLRGATASQPERPPAGPTSTPTDADTREALVALAALLREVDAIPAAPRALLTGRVPASHEVPSRVLACLTTLAGRDPAAHRARLDELAFLANALVAGCSFQARTFRPDEAAAAAAATCNLGLDAIGNARSGETEPDEAAPDLVAAFERGWRLLFDEVSLFTITELGASLAQFRAGDTRTDAGLLQLRHELARQRAAGTPWRVRDALDVLAVLDVPAWTGLLGLTDECPTLAAIVDATLDARRGAVSATDFAFFSTLHQVRRAQAFVRRVPEMLAR